MICSYHRYVGHNFLKLTTYFSCFQLHALWSKASCMEWVLINAGYECCFWNSNISYLISWERKASHHGGQHQSVMKLGVLHSQAAHDHKLQHFQYIPAHHMWTVAHSNLTLQHRPLGCLPRVLQHSGKSQQLQWSASKLYTVHSQMFSIFWKKFLVLLCDIDHLSELHSVESKILRFIEFFFSPS